MLRFCRAIGLAGYPELRIALARAALWEESEQAPGHSDTGQIDPGDSLADVVAKITYADARAIADTAAALDLAVLEKAVDAIVAAAAGRHLRDRGQRAGRRRPASEAAPDRQDLVLLVRRRTSPSPRPPCCGPATSPWASPTPAPPWTPSTRCGWRRRGATTIAITNFAGSPIAAQADLLLTTAARETTFRSGAMSSRIAQLALVDCLFAGVAQRSYDARSRR